MTVFDPPKTAAPERSLIIGIALICLGAICMVGLDASARMLLETYSLPQLVVLRCLFSISLIVAFTAARSELAARFIRQLFLLQRPLHVVLAVVESHCRNQDRRSP